ncbi:MAG: triose-phosphate isomerase [Candidatus Nanopelagicales bacterium]
MTDSSRLPMMAGNWKMNLNHFEAIALVQKLAFALKDDDYNSCEVVVVPPYTDIRSVQTLIDGDKLKIKYGAQDLSAHDAGAFTGEVSGAMLAKLACTYVIVGHSERRQHHAEHDGIVNSKVHAAFRSGLVPIMCVGEGLEVRKEGGQVVYTLGQLEAGLAGLSPEQAASIVIAYEPVWAIGTGEVATPQDAQEVCGAIRARFGELFGQDLADACRVLYGGSVKASNVAGLMAMPDVDGGLVGGASIDPDEFVALVRFRLLEAS